MSAATGAVCGAPLPAASSARSDTGFSLSWSCCFAAAHFVDLHRFVLRGHFDNGIIARYSDTEQIVVGGIIREISEMMRTDLVLLASVSHLRPVGTHAGSVSCRLICKAWGVAVKMLHPCDALNRKRRETNPGLGCTNSEGRLYDDARVSHTFVPKSKALQTWRVPDKVGQGCGKFRQEIALVLVKHSQSLGNPSSAELDAVPEVKADSLGVGISFGNHFDAITNTHGTTEPFPMFKCAPALYTPYDVRDERKYTNELRQWTERNASKAEPCASGVRGEGGRGGVDSAHASKAITVDLGEEGVGKAASNNEGKVASPSAVGAGDSTAAADEKAADDTTAAADTTDTADDAAAVAATVAAAVAATAAAAVGLAVVAAFTAAVAATTTTAATAASAEVEAAAEDDAASTPAFADTSTAAALPAVAADPTAAGTAAAVTVVVTVVGRATAAAVTGAAIGAVAGAAATKHVPAAAVTMTAPAASDEVTPTNMVEVGGVTGAPGGAERSSGCPNKLDASSGNDGGDSTTCCGDNNRNKSGAINSDITSDNSNISNNSNNDKNSSSSSSMGMASSSNSNRGNQCDEPGSTAPNSSEEDKILFPEEYASDIDAAAAAAAKKKEETASSFGARSMTQALGLDIAVGLYPFPTSATATGHKIAVMNVFSSPKTIQRKGDDEFIEMIGITTDVAASIPAPIPPFVHTPALPSLPENARIKRSEERHNDAKT